MTNVSKTFPSKKASKVAAYKPANEHEMVSKANDVSGFMLLQVQAAVTANGRGLFWDERVVEKKLHLLLREWDALHPGPVCLVTLVIS